MQAKLPLVCHANLAEWGGVAVRERSGSGESGSMGRRGADESIMCIEVQQ